MTNKKTQDLSYSIVIPVYNSEKTLDELVERIEKSLNAISVNFEIILVNDGSKDNSWSVIEQLSHKNPWVVGVNLSRNFGQHNAILCGIRTAQYRYILTMDDDLQHPPEEMKKLITELQKGYDVVYGIPKILPHAGWRNFFSKFVKRILARVLGLPSVRDISSFRAFRTELREAFSNFNAPDVIIDALLNWGTTNYSTVLVNEEHREHGESNYNFLKLAKMAMLVLTGFSTAPLRFTSWLGFAFTIFGFIILLYVMTRYIIERSIPGFPFLASVITIFSGTQLFALGIFGEYLAHIFERSSSRPPFVIAKTIKNKQ